MANVVIHPSTPSELAGEWYIQEADQPHFMQTFQRAARFAANEQCDVVEVYLDERTEPKYHFEDEVRICHDEGGWLEYAIIVRWKAGTILRIGAIQRKPGGQSEFHS